MSKTNEVISRCFFPLFQLPLRVHGLRHFLTKKQNRFQNNIPLQLHFDWITETLGHSFRPNIESYFPFFRWVTIKTIKLLCFCFFSLSANSSHILSYDTILSGKLFPHLSCPNIVFIFLREEIEFIRLVKSVFSSGNPLLLGVSSERAVVIPSEFH